MGGLGSGSWYRSSTKGTVEDGRSVDVRRWKREGFFGQKPRAFSWGWYRDGEKVATIGVYSDRSKAELSYSYWSEAGQGEKRDVTYTVPLDWTPCNFGGERPWFLCPGLVNGRACFRRVAKLYLGHGYFLCRHCQDLTYESRNIGRKHAELRKCQKIRKRLGGSANMTEPFPQRPKGMHFKTYLRLRHEYDGAARKYNRLMVADLAKIDALFARIGLDV